MSAGAQAPASPIHGHLVARQARLLRRFERATTLHARGAMRRVHRDLHQVSECLRLLQAPGKPRYAFSSLFLAKCHRELTEDEREHFVFVTGPEIGGAYVPCHTVEFAHARRTVVSVVGDPHSTHKALIQLESAGHRLLAHFHSHPGTGASSTTPSGTDEAYQRRLEDAGFPTVAGIFSRDGYVRFLRLRGEFSVEVHGNGVEQVEERVFRLTLPGKAR